MFDRLILASKYQRIREKFDMAALPEGEEYLPSYNIAPNDNAYVLVPELTFNSEMLTMPKAMQSYFIEKMPTRAIRHFKFGLEGVERETKYFIRSEGDRNLSNDPHYTGSKAIFLNHKYKRIIREQRCLVIADAFILGIEKKPYLVYLKDKKRPFAMAGLWNITIDGNGLLTVPGNQLIGRLGYDRMPVIIPDYMERRWLRKDIELSQVLAMLNPYPYHLMNAYPISDKIKDSENNNLSVIQPIGNRIYSERLEPLPRKRIKAVRDDNLPSWGESIKSSGS
jgi:putative SOS response-associated peptidase YedK